MQLPEFLAINLAKYELSMFKEHGECKLWSGAKIELTGEECDILRVILSASMCTQSFLSIIPNQKEPPIP